MTATPIELMRAAMEQLDRLLQQPESERVALLNELSIAQPQLHAMVVQLLKAERDASGSGFLEPPHSTNTAQGIKPDSTLGPYRIVRQLGAGGMGEVWLARRVDGLYEGNVAIKTLHPHLANTAVRERFTREAHILGKLTHKNIARLHDAGVSETGVTYLVLEYVQGETLDAWCDARCLPVRARLELFLSVCSAVAHAHAHLVVHRDLKPSNILVAQSGGVKLLDFGVAKLVQGDESNIEPTALTQFGGRIFTPEYAAPEQILGEAVTTATDVYALGLLLYGLLSGKRPFGLAGTTGRELERAILNAEPAALATLPSDLAVEIARQRSTTTAKLTSALKGDLEYIVARALRKSPKDRYGSVLAFAVDIERYLQQQPIEAREGSGTYRLGRLVQRHRAAAFATAISIAALLAGSAVALWQAQVARDEARKATAIKDFLIGVFEYNSVAHPDGAQARKTTAEELLAQSARQIRSELHDVPEVRAEMLSVMSGLYASLEMQRESIELREAELNELRTALGPKSIRVAKSMRELAHSQLQIGDYAAAQKTGEEATRIFAEAGDNSSIELAMALSTLAQVASRTGKIHDGTATRFSEASLRIIEQHHPNHPWRLDTLLSLARTATLRNQHEESLRFCQQALDLVESNKITGISGFDRAAVYQVMSVRLRGVHRYAEAETFIARATTEFERSGGADHPFTIDSRREHGTLLSLLGQRAAAKALIAKSVADLERTKGIDDPELTTNARIVLGQVLVARGEFAAAETHLTRALRVADESESAILATAARITLARMQSAQGKFAESARTLDGLEAKSISIGSEGSLRHALALTRLGQFELARGRLSESRLYFEKLDNWPEKPGQMSSGRANAGVGLVRIDLEQGDIAAALVRAKALLNDIEMSQERPIMLDPEADAHMLLGIALLRSGNTADAVPHLQWAVMTRERIDAPQSPWLAEARLFLAQALHRAHNDKAAHQQVDLAKQAVDVSPLAPQYTRLFAETRAALMQKPK